LFASCGLNRLGKPTGDLPTFALNRRAAIIILRTLLGQRQGGTSMIDGTGNRNHVDATYEERSGGSETG
jgi:hypothetical protein